jgi:hypothetical protein
MREWERGRRRTEGQRKEEREENFKFHAYITSIL